MSAPASDAAAARGDGVPASTPRLGFVGVGWIGGLRLDAVERAGAAEVAALCDADGDRLREVGDRFPEAFRTRDLRELLDRSEERGLDGVVLATPNVHHAPQARAVLRRGLPLFVQKPLGLDPAEVREVLGEARRRDVLLRVDYSYRHMDGARRLRSLVREGALGEIELIDATFHNAYGPDKAWCFDPDVSGGGALLDLGVHLLDLAFGVLDVGEPREVRGWVRELEGRPGIDRMTGAELVLGPGTRLRMTTSWHAHAGRDCDFRFEVHGTEGGAELRNREGSFYDFELALRDGRTEDVVAVDERSWMDRGIVGWTRRLPDDGGFDPGAETNLAVAEAVQRIYRRARA